MNLEYFSAFVRSLYPEPASEMSPEDFSQLGQVFKEYLLELFKDRQDKLENIWNIDIVNVALNFDSPIKVKGYHPALVLHFEEFLQLLQLITNQPCKQ